MRHRTLGQRPTSTQLPAAGSGATLQQAWQRLRQLTDEGETSLFSNLQARIDRLTQLAQRRDREAFSFVDRAFLRALYGAMAAGGLAKGWPEAAKLIALYIAKAEGPVEIDFGIYRESPRVQAEMAAQKSRARAATGLPLRVRSKPLLADYPRLKYADNRFQLTSTTTKTAAGEFETVWRVDNSYDFEDFASGADWRLRSKWSEFPVRGQKVVIYDGLSRYLVQLDLAREFDYFATWTETWR